MAHPRKFCKWGHELSKTRRRHPSGGTYCVACKLKRSQYDYEVNRNRSGYRYNKWQRIKQNYGLSREDYESLLCSQGSKCAICFLNKGESWAVDHDHDTGKVRGLLCVQCNTLLGMSRDDINILASAISYLREHESRPKPLAEGSLKEKK